MRFLTGGESHGPSLTAIIEGLPAGLRVDSEAIDRDLARRQSGHGRGGRMRIEQDRVEVLGGIIAERTIGAPVVLRIINNDWANWKERWAMGDLPSISIPRPGHADYAGMRKYGSNDARPILERASARETAARVAIGAVARILLRQFDIDVGSTVCSIGVVDGPISGEPSTWAEIWALSEKSPVRCADEDASRRMMKAIDAATDAKDSLGGRFTVVATGVPAGLGSHVHWDRRLDGLIGQAVLSIPAVKGVEIGNGFANARRRGTEVHDPLDADGRGHVVRPTNRAGGIEGGISNGEPIVVHAAMKPIPTTVSPQRSVDLSTGESAQTAYQRSDVCAVPAAAVVGESMLAWVLAAAVCEKLGGNSIEEMKVHHRAWSERG